MEDGWNGAFVSQSLCTGNSMKDNLHGERVIERGRERARDKHARTHSNLKGT